VNARKEVHPLVLRRQKQSEALVPDQLNKYVEVLVEVAVHVDAAGRQPQELPVHLRRTASKKQVTSRWRQWSACLFVPVAEEDEVVGMHVRF
jgi:hypothetical protein